MPRKNLNTHFWTHNTGRKVSIQKSRHFVTRDSSISYTALKEDGEDKQSKTTWKAIHINTQSVSIKIPQFELLLKGHTTWVSEYWMEIEQALVTYHYHPLTSFSLNFCLNVWSYFLS